MSTRPTRLFGIQIANGFSPEARVFAGLLRHSAADGGPLHGAHVLQHAWRDEDAPPAAERFRQGAGAGVTVETLDFGWRSQAAGRPLAERLTGRARFALALPRALRRASAARPDIVYSSQQLWDCLVATAISRRLRIPQVIHLHFIVGPHLHRPVLRRLLTCDHVVTVSDFIREEALRHGVAPERVTTVRNALPVLPTPPPGARERVRAELGVADGAPLIGIVARLDPYKGQSDTMEAFARLRATGAVPQGARLAVVGGPSPWCPDYGAELEAKVRDLGLGDSVRLLGVRSDVPTLLGAFDLFLHPTRSDPCPLALLEASAAGLPVVAYAEGGALEMVEDGVSGLLASPAGDVGALADAMGALLADPARARAMGAAGARRIATRFRPEDAGAAFGALMTRVAGGGDGNAARNGALTAAVPSVTV